MESLPGHDINLHVFVQSTTNIPPGSPTTSPRGIVYKVVWQQLDIKALDAFSYYTKMTS